METVRASTGTQESVRQLFQCCRQKVGGKGAAPSGAAASGLRLLRLHESWWRIAPVLAAAGGRTWAPRVLLRSSRDPAPSSEGAQHDEQGDRQHVAGSGETPQVEE